VVIENFRPGVAERLGVGPDRLRASDVRLIYCSISGYGSSGPWVHRRAYAPSVGAEAGLTKAQGDARGGVYRNDPHNHADVYTALEACSAILAALLQRTATGEGQFVEVSMAETMMYVNEHAHDALWDRPVHPEWVRSFGTGDFPIVQVGSGDWVVLCGNPVEKGTFERFMSVIGRTDLAELPTLATVSRRRQHVQLIHRAIADYSASVADVNALEGLFAPVGIALGVVRTLDSLANTDWARQRGAIAEIPDRSGGRLRVPNAPWRFSAAPDVGPHGEPRHRGEDNASVMTDLLGLTNDEVAELVSTGVLSARLPQVSTELR